MKSLRSKIALGFFLLTSINLIFLVVNRLYINTFTEKITTLFTATHQNYSYAADFQRIILLQENAQLSFIESPYEAQLLEKFNSNKKLFLDLIRLAQRQAIDNEEYLLLNELKRSYFVYLKYASQLKKKVDAGEENLSTYHNRFIMPTVTNVVEICKSLEQYNKEQIQHKKDTIYNLIADTYTLNRYFFITLLLLGILIPLIVVQNIIPPIKTITSTLRKIRRGQFRQKIEVTTNDEIAELAIEFNRMSKRLDAYDKINIENILAEKLKSEAIVRHLPNGIIVSDKQAKIVHINTLAQQIFSTQEDAVGKPFNNVITDSALQNLYNNPQEKQLIIQKNERYYKVAFFELNTNSVGALGAIILFNDISEFKELDRLKSDFMAMISHEFKTPLTSINMSLDIILNSLKTHLTPQQEEILVLAKEAGKRLTQFSNDLLHLSKLEQASDTLHFEQTELSEVITLGLNPVILPAKAQNCIINTQLPSAPILIWVERNYLGRVISNMMENALKHVPANGKIELSVEIENEALLFKITDNGSGIPPHLQPIIFEKFTQSQNNNNENVGLGLALCKEVIEAHKGRIWFKTSPAGTTFYFTIPLNKKTPALSQGS